LQNLYSTKPKNLREHKLAVRVKVSTKNQIAIPTEVRRKLGIKPGDHLIADVCAGHIVLLPEPANYSEHLRGMHKEVWEKVDAQEYVRGERDAWQN
jgi:AbrB family looped-hinge helix DNA binding protein